MIRNAHDPQRKFRSKGSCDRSETTPYWKGVQEEPAPNKRSFLTERTAHYSYVDASHQPAADTVPPAGRGQHCPPPLRAHTLDDVLFHPYFHAVARPIRPWCLRAVRKGPNLFLDLRNLLLDLRKQPMKPRQAKVNENNTDYRKL